MTGPHTHRVTVQHKPEFAGYTNCVSEGICKHQEGRARFVVYGDQRVKFSHWWEDPATWHPEDFEYRLGRAIQKVVARHDEASQIHTDYQAAVNGKSVMASAIVGRYQEQTGQWGSDL